jgi:toxin ParE1/3/4
MKIIVSDRADNDLMLIFSYLHQRSSQAAELMAGEIDRCFQNMSLLPSSGLPRPELGPDVRSLAVSSYFIFYAVRRDHITVLRILHGSRDIDVEFSR